MVVMHIAYGLDLIALSMGTGLLVWSIKNPGKGSGIGKLFGVLVMIFSIVSMVCMFSCAMHGGRCHGPGEGEGMMMNPPPPPAPPAEAGHEHIKKMEHKR